ncbi:MAG: hypothetical protein WC270_04300 [Patescibacteria group bacterium]
MKVKIFTEDVINKVGSLETAVNEWLAENSKKTNILSQHVSTTAEINTQGKPFVNCTIAIFYT